MQNEISPESSLSSLVRRRNDASNHMAISTASSKLVESHLKIFDLRLKMFKHEVATSHEKAHNITSKMLSLLAKSHWNVEMHEWFKSQMEEIANSQGEVQALLAHFAQELKGHSDIVKGAVCSSEIEYSDTLNRLLGYIEVLKSDHNTSQATTNTAFESIEDLKALVERLSDRLDAIHQTGETTSEKIDFSNQSIKHLSREAQKNAETLEQCIGSTRDKLRSQHVGMISIFGAYEVLRKAKADEQREALDKIEDRLVEVGEVDAKLDELISLVQERVVSNTPSEVAPPGEEPVQTNTNDQNNQDANLARAIQATIFAWVVALTCFALLSLAAL
jgi:Mg2+ and Co2+ transporter CorA